MKGPGRAASTRRTSPIAIALLAIAVLVGAAVRFTDLESAPSGFYMDEASTGYDAFAIARTGRDQHGDLLPLFARSLGDWNEASFRYLVLPSVAIAGNTRAAVRAPAALFGSLTILVFFAFVAQAFGTSAGVAAAWLLALCPWHVHFSRIGFRAILLPLGMLLTLWLLERGRTHARSFAAAIVLGGLTLWTYSAGRLVAPIVFLTAAAPSLRLHWREHRRAGVIGLLLALPLVVALALTWFSPEGLERATQLATFDGPTLARNYPTYFHHRFWLLEGDPVWRHNVPGYGLFTIAHIVFLPFGVLALLVSPTRRRWGVLLLVWLLVAPVPAALTTGRQALRSLPMLFPVIAVSALGVAELARHARRQPIIGVLIALVAFAGVLRFEEWRTEYRVTYRAASYRTWQGPLADVVQRLAASEDDCLVLTLTQHNPRPFILYFDAIDPHTEQARSAAERDLGVTTYQLGRWRVGPAADALRGREETCTVATFPGELRSLLAHRRHERLPPLIGLDGELYFEMLRVHGSTRDPPVEATE